jgi:hypothetical protein
MFQLISKYKIERNKSKIMNTIIPQLVNKKTNLGAGGSCKSISLRMPLGPGRRKARAAGHVGHSPTIGMNPISSGSNFLS